MIDWVETAPDWLLLLAADGLWFIAAALLVAAAAGAASALVSCRRMRTVVPASHQLGAAKARESAAGLNFAPIN